MKWTKCINPWKSLASPIARPEVKPVGDSIFRGQVGRDKEKKWIKRYAKKGEIPGFIALLRWLSRASQFYYSFIRSFFPKLSPCRTPSLLRLIFLRKNKLKKETGKCDPRMMNSIGVIWRFAKRNKQESVRKKRSQSDIPVIRERSRNPNKGLRYRCFDIISRFFYGAG